MFRNALLGFAALSVFSLPVATADDDNLTYYIPLERALEIVPQDKTKHFSDELGRDFTQWPIPWEEQVKNAVTNAGGSDTKDFVGGKKYWVPFDMIPGEESFPMQRRLFLNAQNAAINARLSTTLSNWTRCRPNMKRQTRK